MSQTFYDPKKTFMDLVRDFKGDLMQAYESFEDAWGESSDSRDLIQSMGITEIEYTQWILGKTSLEALVAKYRNNPPAAASLA